MMTYYKLEVFINFGPYFSLLSDVHFNVRNREIASKKTNNGIWKTARLHVIYFCFIRLKHKTGKTHFWMQKGEPDSL